VRIIDPFHDMLDYLFPSAKSFLFLDEGITLRKGITDFPIEGRRWYCGDGKGVYIEVVDWDDDRWVFPAAEAGEGEVQVPVGVVEWVRYLRGFYRKGLVWEARNQLEEREERKNIEIGIVAYLELDGEGRVRAD
jgi:hypothetical protein